LCLIDELKFPPLSISSFIHYLLLFLKLSRSCVLLLLLLLLLIPFTSVIYPSMTSRRRLFLLRKCPIQLAFLRSLLFRSFLFYRIRLKTCSLVTPSDHFIFSILLTTFRSCPNTSAPILLMSSESYSAIIQI
jgi:hypothetical protein